ncbi:MAG: DNA polymerase III subunit delta [Flavobacteriales bacterium]|jgi:DNA polymerase-3 subunit delta
MDHLRIIRDIETKNIKPVYFLMGEEPYFIDLITDKMESSILDEASKAFCQTVVYGRDVSLDQVIGLAKGFPMMGDTQVVIVKEAQDLKEFKRARSKDDDDEDDKSESNADDKKDDKSSMSALEAYVSNPSKTTVLVFAMKNKKLDKRLKFYKALEKVGVIFESEKLKDYKMAEWIKNYAQQLGYGMSPKVAEILAEYLGTDLSKVVNELSKLAIILPQGTQISEQHVEDNIGISKDFNVWELQKALGVKDVLKANRIIHYFENNPKANPIQMVLPSLYSYFTKLAVYIAIPDKSKAASIMGVNPYAVNDYKAASTKYDARKVERIIGYLRTADRQVKGLEGNRIEQGDIYRELIYKTLH